MTGSRLELTRSQILGFRRSAGALDQRLPAGKRYNVFVVAARDLAVFTLGTLPEDGNGRRRAEELAARLHSFLGGARMSYWEAGRAAAGRGDAYLLLQGADRELLVPDPGRRRALWTPRVWPGGLLVDGELAGVWRRAGATMTIQPWRAMSGSERDAVAAEAASLPLPGIQGRIAVRWDN